MKPGYKQTEVGLIPNDWEVTSIGHQSQIYGRIGFRGYTVQDIVGEGNGAIAINPSNIQNGITVFDKCTYISWRKYEESPEIKINEGDVVLVKTGSTFGKTAMVRNLPGKATLNPQVVVFKKIRGSQAFFGYVMGFPIIQNQISVMVVGGALPTLSQKIVATFSFPLPPLPEQRAIAEALSDVDELLGALDRLIAKKGALKQAAMQQLLTGQTRLPGFHGEWEVKRLGDLADLYQPETIGQSVFTSQGYPVYGANGIIGRFNRWNHSTPQITISCRGNCGTVNRTEQYSWITGNAMVVNVDRNTATDPDFLFQLLKAQDFSLIVTGSGQPQIVRGPLGDFTIRLPTEKAEQTAIAQVLSDMDAELVALEQRRDKTRAIKQGMMQELLTGKTRLV